MQPELVGRGSGEREEEGTLTVCGGVLCREYVKRFGGIHRYPSRCLVRVYQEAGRVTVCVCDEGDAVEEKGTSITNWIEHLYGELRAVHGRRARVFTFVEHYPLRGRRFTLAAPDGRGPGAPGERGVYDLPESFATVSVAAIDEYERAVMAWLRRERQRPFPPAGRPQATYQRGLTRAQVEAIIGCAWRPIVDGYTVQQWRALRAGWGPGEVPLELIPAV